MVMLIRDYDFWNLRKLKCKWKESLYQHHINYYYFVYRIL